MVHSDAFAATIDRGALRRQLERLTSGELATLAGVAVELIASRERVSAWAPEKARGDA